MKYIFCLVSLFFILKGKGQDTTLVIAKYRIIESMHNKRMLSDFDQARKGVIYIHYDKENILHLSNISLKDASFSTGELLNIKIDSTFSSYKKLIKTKAQYTWKYSNSYDKNKGSALVTMIEETTNYGNTFQMIMSLGKNNKIIYKGFKIDETTQYIIPKTIF